MNWLSEIRSRFETALAPWGETAVESASSMIRPAQDPRFGDFQANMAMPLAKSLGKPPRAVAEEIVANLRIEDLCDAPEIAGPGFINLRIRDDQLAAATAALAADERVGVARTDSPRTVIVDFSSPNVAKPMHVGHLRSTVIGDALARTYRFLGHNVIGDNHIGDWGTQFGMILYGYQHFLNQEAFDADAVGELGRLYRLVNQLSDYHESRKKLPELRAQVERESVRLAELQAQAKQGDKSAKEQAKRLAKQVEELREEVSGAEQRVARVEGDSELVKLAAEHPDIAKAARRETAKLHGGDADNLRLWEEFLPVCLAALNQMYARLGVIFDEALGESFYQPMLGKVVENLQARGLAETSDGAICVFNEGFKAPFLIRKADGAFLYATTDLATIQYRVDRWNPDEMLYVVDKRQSEHFEQLFATARRMGFDRVSLRHVSFGTILGDDRRPFKTRSGDTVGLESLLDEAVERALEIVAASDDAKPDGPEWDATERRRIAEIVGLGGIKYADLKHNRESDYVFSWEKMLSTTGDTATYMQYAYARISGIARRGNIDSAQLRTGEIPVLLEKPQERALALQLNRFSEAVEGVARDARPNVMTDYLFGLAGVFTSFYDACPVLKAESEELRLSRLVLCDVTARVIEKGLDLLGIQVSEAM